MKYNDNCKFRTDFYLQGDLQNFRTQTIKFSDFYQALPPEGSRATAPKASGANLLEEPLPTRTAIFYAYYGHFHKPEDHWSCKRSPDILT